MYDNPMKTDGFEFVEFATNDPAPMQNLFKSLGFTLTAKHKTKDVELYQQHEINFILNYEKTGFASDFAKEHGPSACGMAFRVEDADFAMHRALELGAKEYTGNTSNIKEGIKAIYGIGDSLLYLVDEDTNTFYTHEFETVTTQQASSKNIGLRYIDHLTHNVFRGNMDKWAEFYERLFNFREIRFFDIQGKHTGLQSRAMSSPCNKIRIPLNESKDGQSQIEEFLKDYNGEGIQHIALLTDNIYNTIEDLRSLGQDFMDTPDTYYELLNDRLPEHKEDATRMHKNKILIDGGEAQGGGYLLQIFTNTVIGPIFFEIIQRKGNEGFGEGNFQALFDSIELDQVRRGVIDTDNDTDTTTKK